MTDHWSKQLYQRTDDMYADLLFYTYRRNGIMQDATLIPHGEVIIDDVFITSLVLNYTNIEEYRIPIYQDIDQKLLIFLRDESGYPNSLFVDEN